MYQKVSTHVLWKIDRKKNRDIYWGKYKIQETLYIVQWHLSPLQSRHLGTSHSSPNHHQLPHHIFLNLTDGLKSFSFQFQFWEKPEVTGCQIWAVKGLSHLGDLMFCKKKNCTRHDAWAGILSWWSHQLPVAHSYNLLNHPNSFHGGIFTLDAKFDADLLLYLLSHFECDSHTGHMLTWWASTAPTY